MFGCSSSNFSKKPSLDLSTLVNWPTIYKKNFSLLKNLQSKSRLSIESSDLSTNVNVKLIYIYPDSLYLKAEGILGLDLGEIFIGNKRFILYNQFNNQFVAGSMDEEYYNTFLQTNFTFKQIKNAVIGYIPIPENIKLIDETNGIFSATVENSRWKFVVDKQSGFLKNFEIIEQGKVVLRQEFKRYRSINGLVIPGLIRIIVPNRMEMVSFFHKDLVVNDILNSKQYRIEIGPKVKQLIVGN
jgi:hypothetical protein